MKLISTQFLLFFMKLTNTRTNKCCLHIYLGYYSIPKLGLNILHLEFLSLLLSQSYEIYLDC